MDFEPPSLDWLGEVAECDRELVEFLEDQQEEARLEHEARSALGL